MFDIFYKLLNNYIPSYIRNTYMNKYPKHILKFNLNV